MEDPVPVVEPKVHEEKVKKTDGEDGDNDDSNSDDDEDGEGEGDSDDEGKKPVEEERIKKKKQKRTLKQSEKIVYAPFCNLGFLNYEKSGGYITIPDEHVVFTKKSKQDLYDDEGNVIEQIDEEDELDEGVKMVRDLQDMKTTLNQRLDDDDDVELLDGIDLDDETDSRKKNSLGFTVEEQKNYDFKEKQKEIVNLKFKTKNLASIATAVEQSQSVLSTDLQDLIYG